MTRTAFVFVSLIALLVGCGSAEPEPDPGPPPAPPPIHEDAPPAPPVPATRPPEPPPAPPPPAWPRPATPAAGAGEVRFVRLARALVGGNFDAFGSEEVVFTLHEGGDSSRLDRPGPDPNSEGPAGLVGP